MKKRYLRLFCCACALCIFNFGKVAAAYAEAPIEDYSTEASAATSAGNSPRQITRAPSTPAVTTSAASTSSTWQETKKENSPPSSYSPQISAAATPVSANMSVENRVKRLEQQINYLNRNNPQMQLEDLKQKLQKAGGELEEQQQKLAHLEKQLDDFYTDLDQRIKNNPNNKEGVSAKISTEHAAKTTKRNSSTIVSATETTATGNHSDTTALDTSLNTAANTEAVITKIAKSQGKNGEKSKVEKSPKTNSNSKSNKKGNSSANITTADANIATPPSKKTNVSSNSSATSTTDDNANANEGDVKTINNASAPADLNLKKKETALKEQQSYQAAFNYLQNRQFDDGAKELKKYLSTYPNGMYAANAHYWLGEIYFLNNSYAKSSSEFDIVTAKYAASPKVPEAMFKLAYIHNKEGKRDQAKKEYLKLKKRYPNSAAAKLAEQQLQQMQ